MIGIDTNVLVRYIVQDDPEQSAQSTLLIEQECNLSSPGYLSNIVLCELVWVLTGAYKYDKNLVIEVMEQILVTAEFLVENENVVRKAINDYKIGSADFSDYLIVNNNQQSGCTKTYTFKKKLLQHNEAHGL